MVGHLKWNRGQVHTAVSKMSPEHLCWAVAEHKQTKGRMEMGQRLLGQELQLSMCPICLAQAEVLTAKLTFKFDQVQKWQFFQPNTGRLCLVPCTQSKAAQSWACAFSQAHLLYFGCRAAFSHPHLMATMLSWEVGCGLEGPVSLRNHTLPRQWELMGRQN